MKPRKELIGPSNVADRKRLRSGKPVRTARQRAGGIEGPEIGCDDFLCRLIFRARR
jgi:hypothetical protein